MKSNLKKLKGTLIIEFVGFSISSALYLLKAGGVFEAFTFVFIGMWAGSIITYKTLTEAYAGSNEHSKQEVGA
ncbi:MAG: hypothetical protein ACYCSO_05275 [Cuniculiplasma sp.]